MIYTLTFSPSIDYFIKVKDFESVNSYIDDNGNLLLVEKELMFL